MYQSPLASLSGLAPPPGPQSSGAPSLQSLQPPPLQHSFYPEWSEELWSPAPFPPPPMNSGPLGGGPGEGMAGLGQGGPVEGMGPALGLAVGSSLPPPPMGPAALAAPPVSPGLCVICEDRATGRHYGANSCDGCKGFFRRTIRKAQNYVCRFEKRCLIDKDKRNSCRFCRFAKCMEAGMKPDAVQNERDRIQTRRLKSSAGSSTPSSPAQLGGRGPQFAFPKAASPQPSASPTNPSYDDTIRTLMKAEEYYTASQLRATVITRTDNQMPIAGEGDKIANMSDISESMRQQLLLMVEWAKTLSPFAALSMGDQVCLLRAYAAQHLLICVAWRSRSASERLLLTNATCLPRNVPSSDISDANHVTVRALDELVRPIKVLDVDEVEFVCLRAIVFFNPMAKGLEDAGGLVAQTRETILGALQQHIRGRRARGEAAGATDGAEAGGEPYRASEAFRFAHLLLLLPPLQAIAQNLREDLQLASMFGMARIDSLLQELLISEGDAGEAQAAQPAASPLLFPNMGLDDADMPQDPPPQPQPSLLAQSSQASQLKTEA